MISICMERRERNQVMIYARRAETTGGTIADLIARCEWIQDNASLKHDHGQSKCQEFQLIRVFGTDSTKVIASGADQTRNAGVSATYDPESGYYIVAWRGDFDQITTKVDALGRLPSEATSRRPGVTRTYVLRIR
jgi:hypothetical protein